MSSIETVVQVNITQGTQQVSVTGFGVPVIFGSSARFGDAIRYYTGTASMLADGFLISDPEYIHAVEAFSQSAGLTQVGVSHFTPSVAQVDTFAVSSLVSTHDYVFTLNGTLLSYTASGGDTQQSILSALLTQALAISPAVVSGAVTGTGSSALLTLTSTVAGVGVTYSLIDADLTHVALTLNHSIVNDIVSLQQVDDTWYGVLVTSKAASDIEQVAAYVETQKKIYLSASQDSGILTSVTTDVASLLKAKTYKRTGLIYNAVAANAADAAWIGRMFPTTPGNSNWKFKTLKGITADNLSATSTAHAQGKSANVYVTLGGVSLTTEGVVASGEYIDVTILIDWIQATMESNIFSILVNSEKIPFTNQGIAAIENAVRQTLQTAQDNGGLAAGWVVSAPDISAISTADKAARTLNGVTFTATLAGAINKVTIQGYVAV